MVVLQRFLGKKQVVGLIATVTFKELLQTL
ncbi:hypothetical protein Alsa4_CDS0230 [Staphylococcus phage Alsa_4]|nr:hypothetical protein Alsa4_CDS0230 [Staphylococcus phage Alsa_4]